MTSLMVSIALALVGNLATNTVQVQQAWWPWVVWAVVGLLFAGALVNEIAARRADQEAPAGNRINEAKDWLAAQEKDQRTEDVHRARLRRPVPLRVRWSSTARPVAASRSVVLNATADVAWRDAPLAGDVGGIVTEFRRLPNQQLVVLGRAGAGKSSLVTLLGLGLLESRQTALSQTLNGDAERVDRDHPIPVYLSIASWRPENEHIETFIVRRLDEQFEFPKGAPAYGTSFADVLMRQGCLVPVLDGLDELPAELLASAIEGLEAFAATRRPFVLTCRIAEYEQAVARSGLLLSRAAVVEIEPVDVEAAITFIEESVPNSERWDEVFTHLRHSPDSPLAQVLSTPLMVSLARIAYRAPGAHPRDLLRLPDFTSIAASLLDQFISSAYPRQAHRERVNRRYDQDRVTGWLTFLAHHLYQSGKRDFRWWQLTPVLVPKLLQRHQFLLGIAELLVFLAIGSVGGLFLGGWHGLELSLVATAIFSAGTNGTFAGLWRSPYQPPGQPSPHVPTGTLFGLFLGVLGGVLAGHPLAGLCAGVLLGVHATLVPHWSAHTLRRRAPDFRARCSPPAQTIRVNRWNAALAATQYGLVGGLAFAIVGHFVFGVPEPLTTAVTGGAVCALGAAYAAGLGTWTRFRVTSCTLAMLGRLPWRLVTFLDDAYQRGALRVAGESWQFRHALLQDHLSEKVQPKNLWARIEDSEGAAVNRLADLYAAQGRTGELRAIAGIGNRYATFRLIDSLESIGCVDEAITIARSLADSDWTARTRLADLLADHGRTDSLRTLAGTGNSHAITRLAVLLADSADIDGVVRLAHVQMDTNGWRAAVPVLDLLSRHGQVDTILGLAEKHVATLDVSSHYWLIDCLAKHGRLAEMRALARQGDMWVADRMLEVLVSLGCADEAIDIATERAVAGAWIPTKRLIKVLVSAGRLDDALAITVDLARTGNKLANELFHDLLAAQGAIGTIEALARSGNALALGQHACLLAEQGRVVEAMTLVRDHGGKLEVSDVLTVMELVAKHGHVDELRPMAASGNTQVVVQLMKLLAATGNGDEAISIANRYRDVRDRLTVGQIIGTLVEIDRASDALRLAQSYDRSGLGEFTSELIHHLVAQDRPDEAIGILRGFAESGSKDAMDWLIDLLATSGRMDEAIHLAEETANPRKDTWAVVDQLISLLTREGRIDDAITIARLRADAGRTASWARLRTS